MTQKQKNHFTVQAEIHCGQAEIWRQITAAGDTCTEGIFLRMYTFAMYPTVTALPSPTPPSHPPYLYSLCFSCFVLANLLLALIGYLLIYIFFLPVTDCISQIFGLHILGWLGRLAFPPPRCLLVLPPWPLSCGKYRLHSICLVFFPSFIFGYDSDSYFWQVFSLILIPYLFLEIKMCLIVKALLTCIIALQLLNLMRHHHKYLVMTFSLRVNCQSPRVLLLC